MTRSARPDPVGVERLDCARVEADVVLLLDGGLDALRVEAVNAHFGQCPRCAAYFGDLRRMLVHESARVDDADFAWGELPETDFGALSSRLERADVGGLSRLLYEILKAEFLFDYGDNVEVAAEPIMDPDAERRRGAAWVEELRDWVDGDEAQGVDLREVARRFSGREADVDRLGALIDGMRAVGRYDRALGPKAEYYVALAHLKARRAEEACQALQPLADGPDASLSRLARITLAVIPGMLRGDPAASVLALETCLVGDALDTIVHFNLARACFDAAGEVLDDATRLHLDLARAAAPELVERQLSVASARKLRLALQESRPLEGQA